MIGRPPRSTRTTTVFPCPSLSDLGGDQLSCAPALPPQPFADHARRFAAGMAVDPGRIDVGGIDHAPAAIDEAVENREAGLLVRRPAEHIAAGHQRRGFEIGGAEAAERGHRSISWLATA